MPNKLSNFWQELKRRNVVRVVTVYAGAAFVLLELVDMITDPFGLPAWTFKLAIVILSIGFVVAIILSWIYDIHPEGGMVKTEPADKAKAKDLQKLSSGWKIASYISFVVIVGLIVLNVIPRNRQKNVSVVLDKSIAVLPFISLSDDPEKQYQADGVMDEILLHLCKIEDLRVMSRTSVEQYRDTDMTINEICEELGVSYILEGSFRRYEDQARLIVQLIQSGKEEHIWANNYDRDWKDIFTVESEVAQSIANELRAVITPGEMEIIESIPTLDISAYDYYQRAENELMKTRPINASRYDIIQEALAAASIYYKLAIASDPGYAEAYVGLGKVHRINYNISGDLSDADLDSVLYYAESALEYNNRLASAHTLKGQYLNYSGNIHLALEEFTVAKELNPNDFEVYENLSRLYFWYIDWAQSFFYLHKAFNLVGGDQRRSIRNILVFRYASLGLFEEANIIAEKSIRMDGDSAAYIRNQGTIEMCRGNYEKCIEWQIKSNRYNPQVPLSLTGIARDYSYLGRYAEALTYAEKYLEQGEMTNWNEYSGQHHMAVIYWHNGFREKAQELVHNQISYLLELVEQGSLGEKYGQAYFDLFLCYAFLGDKTEAYKSLYQFIKKSPVKLAQFLTYLQDDPLADNLRDDEEYRQIVRQYEEEFQSQRDRIRQWLEENEML